VFGGFSPLFFAVTLALRVKVVTMEERGREAAATTTERIMIVAFIITSRTTGESTVQTMGDVAAFGDAVCGATFTHEAAAVAFLRRYGFVETGVGSWLRMD
jgi:hypothetical protein